MGLAAVTPSLAMLAFAAALVLPGSRLVSLAVLQWLTGAALLLFGIYNLLNYYRHPRWVGLRDLFLWSFLMATAHGAGLMVLPALNRVAGVETEQGAHAGHGMLGGASILLTVGVHTLAMLLVMGATAWLVYRRHGLDILRQHWINFDLIWAVALLLAAAIAALMTM